MGERTVDSYKRLFEVWLLSHFWLDQGATPFDLIPDQSKKDARLLAYDVRSFLEVRPTVSTEQELRALGSLFRNTGRGFLVAVPETAILPADTVLRFIVSVRGDAFFDYTALTLRPQKVYELVNPADKLTYRYKENVSVLSNLSGTTRGSGANMSLFLSREIPPPTPDDPVESLVLSGGALLQLTSDNPGAATQQLAAHATDLPVYVNQGDAPPIVPPAGLVGAPARGVELSGDVPEDAFAVISLTAVRAGDDAFSFVDGAGAPKPVPPIYQVRLKNRSTVWTYLDKSTGGPIPPVGGPLPLTHFGNAGSRQKPSRGHVKADRSGAKITRLISEIYV